MQVATPNQGIVTPNIVNDIDQGSLGENNLGSQLTDLSQVSNETKIWTQILEQTNNDRVERMREAMNDKVKAIPKELCSNKCISTVKKS